MNWKQPKVYAVKHKDEMSKSGFQIRWYFYSSFGSGFIQRWCGLWLCFDGRI